MNKPNQMKKPILFLSMVIISINLVSQVNSDVKSDVRQELYKSNGFQNFSEFGVLTGVGIVNSYSLLGSSYKNDALGLSLSTTNGWLINTNVFVGLGIGVEKFSSDYQLPLFLNTRFFILSKKIKPFCYSDIGYSWRWNSESTGSDWGGLLIGLGAGCAIQMTKNSSVFISIGYKIQQVKLEWMQIVGHGQYAETIIELENSFSNLAVIKFGFGF